jgi:uncharacterized surface protein with fasciclin (FAS1) repeats
MAYDTSKTRTKIIGSAASLAAFLAFTGRAQAQEAGASATGLVDISGIDGVASVVPLTDGSVRVTMDDGSSMVLSAGDVVIENGVVFADPEVLAAASPEAGHEINPYLIGAGVVGAGLVIAASSDDDDDDGGGDAPAPVNSAPTFTSGDAVNVGENSVDTGYTATADDADGDDLTFSISGGADADRFEIDAGTGALSFVEAPDFETPGDADGDNAYEVELSVTDGEATASQTVTVTVDNINDNAPVIVSGNAVTVNENGTEAIQVTAEDADGDALTFSLSGDDAALFAIDAATGLVTFVDAPDFEVPADADGDNVYEFTVTASDGENEVTQAISITVADVVENETVVVTEIVDGETINLGTNDEVDANDAGDIATGDTIDLSPLAAGVFVDLDSANQGALNPVDPTQVGELTQNPTVTLVDVENIIGTDFDDTLFGNQESNVILGGDGDDAIHPFGGVDFVDGGEGTDTFLLAAAPNGVTIDFETGVAGPNTFVNFENANGSTTGGDTILGDDGANVFEGLGGDDTLNGRGGADTLIGGDGADRFQFSGDPFDGADVSADGRQIVGNEDTIEDFEFGSDVYAINAPDFGINDDVRFQAVDANADGATIPAGTNVVVLLNSDNDADPETPFLAGTAANQIAELTEADGAGFFVYWNSNLGVNRLVYSTNLNDANADLKIVARQSDLEGQDAIDALASFSADNFEFDNLPPTILDIAADSDDFDILEAALVATGLDAVVDDRGAEFTVFAPTDDAFARLAQDLGIDTAGLSDEEITGEIVGALQTIAGGEEEGLALLSDVLLYHVSPGAQELADLQSTGTITTALEGVTFDVDGTTLEDNDLTITDPQFVDGLTDLGAANGVIQVIDRVLLPVDVAGDDGGAGAAPVSFAESADGDLSDDFSNPTDLGTLGLGDNTVVAQQGDGGDVDYVTFTIAEGEQLSELILDDYDADAGNLAFLGLQEGAAFTTDAASTGASDLLGGLTYGASNAGGDILQDVGNLSGSTGFDGPLEAGTYTLWLNQTGAPSTASFTLRTESVDAGASAATLTDPEEADLTPMMVSLERADITPADAAPTTSPAPGVQDIDTTGMPVGLVLDPLAEPVIDTEEDADASTAAIQANNPADGW